MTSALRNFPSSFQANAVVVPKAGDNHYRSCPFRQQLTISAQLSIRGHTAYDTGGVVL
jgi:hypothetical protein